MFKKPFFIAFEGVEGCGKSYQSKKLFKKLKDNNFKAILTREPGGTKSAELIRDLILKDYFSNSKKEKFDKYTDTLLYLAARNEHVKNKIEPDTKKILGMTNEEILEIFYDNILYKKNDFGWQFKENLSFFKGK